MNSVHFSSATDMWSTPPDFFEALDSEFWFTLDVCATAENAKCKRYFTREQNGLAQDWTGNTCWMNPPYGREIGKWVRKASHESGLLKETRVVCLLPARTDTRWFHDYIWNAAANQTYPGVEIRLLKGRLKFGGSKNAAPFPSMVVVFGETVRWQPVKFEEVAWTLEH